MTTSFTVTFVVKGLFSLILGIESLKNQEPLVHSLHLWAGLMFLVSEMIPASIGMVLTIRTYNAGEEHGEDSTIREYEMKAHSKNTNHNKDKGKTDIEKSLLHG